MYKMLYPQGRNHSTRRIEGWVDPRVGLDVVVKRKILPCWELNPSHNFTSVIISGYEKFSINYGCLI
jgi:hypothetical protein